MFELVRLEAARSCRSIADGRIETLVTKAAVETNLEIAQLKRHGRVRRFNGFYQAGVEHTVLCHET
ncbi:MAG: hypothetical protein ABSD96_04895 [Candidatus Korobacteraceae bacterium]